MPVPDQTGARVVEPLVTEWVFRYAGGALIDLPDLPIPAVGSPWQWVATLWPEPLAPQQWGYATWTPAPRGFYLPNNLAVGDVVEFGIATNDATGAYIPSETRRWYGWLDRVTERSVIIHGPYPNAAAALAAAQPAIDLIRLNELTGPAVAGMLDPEWSDIP